MAKEFGCPGKKKGDNFLISSFRDVDSYSALWRCKGRGSVNSAVFYRFELNFQAHLGGQ